MDQAIAMAIANKPGELGYTYLQPLESEKASNITPLVTISALRALKRVLMYRTNVSPKFIAHSVHISKFGSILSNAFSASIDATIMGCSRFRAALITRSNL